MAHPYESSREMHPGRKAAESRVKAYASGGKVRASTPSAPVAKRATGGSIEYKIGGAVSAPRADRFARGGKTKHHKGTHINIAVIAPHGKPDMGAAPGGPPGMPPGMPPGLPSGGPPVGVPPGGAPGGMPGAPGGLPPGPMKRGGRAYAKGGKVNMSAGAYSGEGRLEKIKAYGAKAKKD